MSKRAESLVWDRSRAGKSDLLMLVKIADLADDEGRNAWPEIPALARWIRSTERGALYILHRLEQDGEIVIEVNTEGREIRFKGGRTFRPKWFIHVRCVADWEAYQTESGAASAPVSESEKFSAQSEKIADSVTGSDPITFPRGRPRRQSEKISDSAPSDNPQTFRGNPNGRSEKSEKTGNAYKEGSVTDPPREQEQGLTPRPSASNNEEPEGHLAVITRIVHEVLAPFGDPGEDLPELVKDYIGRLNSGRDERSKIRYDSTVVGKAIDSARWQRANPRLGRSA